MRPDPGVIAHLPSVRRPRSVAQIRAAREAVVDRILVTVRAQVDAEFRAKGHRGGRLTRKAGSGVVLPLRKRQ